MLQSRVTGHETTPQTFHSLLPGSGKTGPSGRRVVMSSRHDM